jgi:hypothetical protein
MNNNIDIVYSKYIKPLAFYERIILAQRILNDFAIHERKHQDIKNDRIAKLKRFKGIARDKFVMITIEDWYKQ